MPPSMSDDLAYLRDLAESGQNAPLLGGRFLAWWGGMAAFGYSGHYLIASGMLDFGGMGFVWLWSCFAVLGIGGYLLLVSSFPQSKPGVSSAGNRISATVWMAGGFVMFSFFAGVIALSLLQGRASFGFIWSVPLVLGVYGLCQLASGLLANSRPLILAGWGAIASVGISAMATGSDMIWLVGAMVAALTVFLPGIILMKNEPSEVV